MRGTFVDLCDTFNLPLVFLQDVPGLMIGREAGRASWRRSRRGSSTRGDPPSRHARRPPAAPLQARLDALDQLRHGAVVG
jgi:hypothetical protein